MKSLLEFGFCWSRVRVLDKTSKTYSVHWEKNYEVKLQKFHIIKIYNSVHCIKTKR